MWTFLKPATTKKSWDGTNKSGIGWFALENAIKAFLVYENPQWISNGKLGRPLRSHKLIALQKQSKHIPFKKRYVWCWSGSKKGWSCGADIRAVWM